MSTETEPSILGLTAADIAAEPIAEPAPVAAEPATPAAPPPAPKAFQQASLLSDPVLRKLRTQQAEFAQSLGARLAAYLRTELALRVAGVQTVSFAKFIDRLATPTHLTLLKLEPLAGIGLLELPPQVALRIVDCQLGGAGRVSDPDRALTEIEVVLLDHVSEMFLAEWCLGWRDQQELQPVLLGHELDTRFLNTIPRDAMVLEISCELTLHEKAYPIRLGFPLRSLNPLLRAWENNGTAPAASAPAPGGAPVWNPVFDAVPVTLSARCAAGRLPARTLAALKVGDSVPVDSAAAQRVAVQVGGTVKFWGTLGSSEGRWAIELTNREEPK